MVQDVGALDKSEFPYTGDLKSWHRCICTKDLPSFDPQERNLLTSHLSATHLPHRRNGVGYYKQTDLYNGYCTKVKAGFSDDSLCRFVQELRNYMLHKEIPVSTLYMSWSEGQEIKCGLMIPSASLLEWRQWSVSASLEGRKEIHPRALATEYWDKVIPLHEWIDEQLEAYHRPALDELRVLQERLDETES